MMQNVNLAHMKLNVEFETESRVGLCITLQWMKEFAICVFLRMKEN